MTKQIGFYMIHNHETNEFYFGSGVLEDRRRSHLYKLNNGIHENYKLQKAYNKNPNFDFISVSIDETDSRQDNRDIALSIEQELIDNFIDSDKCLNIAKSVEACFIGRTHTNETIKRFSEDKLKKWQDESYREKIIEAQRNGWSNLSPEKRSLFSNSVSNGQKNRYLNGERSPTLGQKRTEEFKRADSIRTAELWKDPEFREKNLNARKGKIKGFPSIKVEINGVVYESLTKAANELNMSITGIVYRCESLSDKFSGWKRLDSLNKK